MPRLNGRIPFGKVPEQLTCLFKCDSVVRPTAVCPPRGAVGGVLLLVVHPLNIDKAAAASGGAAAACASCSRRNGPGQVEHRPFEVIKRSG